MVSDGTQRQIIIGVGTAITTSIITATAVFFILVMRKRMRDKHIRLQNIRRAMLDRPRSHSNQSALSAAGYSAGAGFSNAAATIDDVQDGRQMRTVTAYNRKSFRAYEDYGSNPGTASIMEPWESSRSRPLHLTNDPLDWRNRGRDRTNPDSITSSRPPSEGRPAMVPFRPSKLPTAPTTFYTYDGRVDHSEVSRPSSPYASIGENVNNNHSRQSRLDGRSYYYGRQLSNQSHESIENHSSSRTSGQSSNEVVYAKINKQPKRLKRENGDIPGVFSWNGSQHPQHSEIMNNRPHTELSQPDRRHSNHVNGEGIYVKRNSLVSERLQNHTGNRKLSDGLPSSSNRDDKEPYSWAGMNNWRQEYDKSHMTRRSGSYDELESRRRQRLASDESAEDRAVFDWMPNSGPVIRLDHTNSATYDGNLSEDDEHDDYNNNRGESQSSSESMRDYDSALWSMEDLPKFTKSTATLDLPNLTENRSDEAVALEEMYY